MLLDQSFHNNHVGIVLGGSCVCLCAGSFTGEVQRMRNVAVSSYVPVAFLCYWGSFCKGSASSTRNKVCTSQPCSQLI